VGWLLDLIMRAVAFLCRRPAPTPPPSRVEVQTDRAAVAETKLQTAETGNEAAAHAVAAVRAVDDQLVRQPDTLRAPDPYSRD
jgi:hypothetical protein